MRDGQGSALINYWPGRLSPRTVSRVHHFFYYIVSTRASRLSISILREYTSRV